MGARCRSRKENIVWKPIAMALAVLSLSCAASRVAAAAETLRVAVPDRGAWNTSYTELGLQRGLSLLALLSEFVVYASAPDIKRIVDRARQGADPGRIRVSEHRVVGAEVNVEIFRLHEPVRSNHHLEAGASRPT